LLLRHAFNTNAHVLEGRVASQLLLFECPSGCGSLPSPPHLGGTQEPLLTYLDGGFSNSMFLRTFCCSCSGLEPQGLDDLSCSGRSTFLTCALSALLESHHCSESVFYRPQDQPCQAVSARMASLVKPEIACGCIRQVCPLAADVILDLLPKVIASLWIQYAQLLTKKCKAP